MRMLATGSRGSSGPVPRSWRDTKSTVSGISCITPTARVDDTLFLCQPDSCQARAMARSPGTPASREKRRKATRRPARSAGTTIFGAVRTAARVAAGIGQALGAEAAELVVAGVDEAHGLGQAVMSGLVPDEAPHLQAHRPVGGMALGAGPQLEDVHRLPGVHLHGEADPVGQRHGV